VFELMMIETKLAYGPGINYSFHDRIPLHNITKEEVLMNDAMTRHRMDTVS
jgi:hypothetical protein